MYYEKRLLDSNNKHRESWRIVNELRGKCSIKTNSSNFSSKELNSFYCSVASELTSQLSNIPDFRVFLGDVRVSETFFLAPTNVTELGEIF